MKIAVIVPVHNGGEAFTHCLRGICSSDRKPDDVVIVDDGSTDGATDAVVELGFRHMRLQNGPLGPAAARNRGVAIAAPEPDILLFVDADVVIQPGTIGQIVEIMTREPEIAALFGSYDESPRAQNITSQYKNLLHHFMHQNSALDASTFWAGCGAVRYSVFKRFGGFNENYIHPSIEDIELGMRLRRAGCHIMLRPELQVKHLKRWSLRDLVYTDIFRRAIPWSRLLIAEDKIPDELNLQLAQRLSAVVALIIATSIAISFWHPVGLILFIGSASLFAALNFGLLRFFYIRRGILFALAACVLHIQYQIYSAAAFCLVFFQEKLRKIFARRTHK